MNTMGQKGEIAFCIIILCGLFCFHTNASFTIDVIHLASPEGNNSIINSDFEEGSIAPTGWRFTTSNIKLARGEWSNNAFSGDKCVAIQTDSGNTVASWRQENIEIKPDTDMLLSAWINLGGGKIRYSAIGYDSSKQPIEKVFDQRINLSSAKFTPLYPVFVKAKHLSGNRIEPGWQRHRLFFKNTNANRATVICQTINTSEFTGEVLFDKTYFGPAWSELSVSIVAEDDTLIEKVIIYDDMEENIYETENLNLSQWQQVVKIPSDILFFKVVVQDNKGNKIEKMFNN